LNFFVKTSQTKFFKAVSSEQLACGVLIETTVAKQQNLVAKSGWCVTHPKRNQNIAVKRRNQHTADCVHQL